MDPISILFSGRACRPILSLVDKAVHIDGRVLHLYVSYLFGDRVSGGGRVCDKGDGLCGRDRSAIYPV